MPFPEAITKVVKINERCKLLLFFNICKGKKEAFLIPIPSTLPARYAFLTYLTHCNTATTMHPLHINLTSSSHHPHPLFTLGC